MGPSTWAPAHRPEHMGPSTWAPAHGPRHMGPSTSAPAHRPQHMGPSTWAPAHGPQHVRPRLRPSRVGRRRPKDYSIRGRRQYSSVIVSILTVVQQYPRYMDGISRVKIMDSGQNLTILRTQIHPYTLGTVALLSKY